MRYVPVMVVLELLTDEAALTERYGCYKFVGIYEGVDLCQREFRCSKELIIHVF